MKKDKEKLMSDGEASDFAYKKLIGDLGGIEADGLFKKDEAPAASPGPGHLKIEITHSAGGQADKPESLIHDPEEDEEDKRDR